MPEVQSRNYANPRRLPRRNHYKEGPGFLFVATQGGRPYDKYNRQSGFLRYVIDAGQRP